MDDSVHYAKLEAGARWLAARAATASERHEHLGWANRYYRLGLHARECERPLTRVAA